MNKERSLLYWFVGFVFCAAGVVISINYIDRPVATLVESHVRHTAGANWIAAALKLLAVVDVIAPLFLFLCGCWIISGHRLSSWTYTPLVCSWSMMWALSATIVLKQIFGRGSAEIYAQRGIYEFRLLEGGATHDSFPSGTAAVSAAIFSVLWIRAPRLRLLWALGFLLPTVAVVAINGHFVADVIAGGFLGASTGWMTVRLLTSQSIPPANPPNNTNSTGTF